MSYFSQRVVAPFIRKHPLIGGAALAAVAMLMMVDSVRTAHRVESLSLATPMAATVSSVSQVSSIPQRWDAEVRMEDGRQARVRVGPSRLGLVQPGASVTVLLPDGVAENAVLEAQRPRVETISLGPVRVTSLFFGGLAMLAIGVFVAVFGQRLPPPPS